MLTEEVADTALGLILCTVREFPQAERYLRAGKWIERAYPLTKATLRDRNVGHGRHGRHRAGDRAPARRHEACRWSIIRAGRRRASRYRYYPKLIDMARDVNTLVAITPGGPETKNLINAEVMKALGPEGIVINMARGSVVDEPALIEALKSKTIMAAGLDVYVNEPEVPAELMAMENVVLFPISARRRSIPARRWTSSWSTTSPPGRPASRRSPRYRKRPGRGGHRRDGLIRSAIEGPIKFGVALQ